MPPRPPREATLLEPCLTPRSCDTTCAPHSAVVHPTDASAARRARAAGTGQASRHASRLPEVPPLQECVVDVQPLPLPHPPQIEIPQGGPDHEGVAAAVPTADHAPVAQVR